MLTFAEVQIDDRIVLVDASESSESAQASEIINKIIGKAHVVFTVVGKDSYGRSKGVTDNPHILVDFPGRTGSWKKIKACELGEYESYQS